MRSRLEALAEAIDGWEPAIALVVVLGLLLAGFAFGGFGRVEALAVGFGFPVAVLFASGVGIKDHRGAVLIAGLLVGVGALVAAEEQVSEVLVTRSTIGRANLHVGEALTLEDGPGRMRVEAHGDVHGDIAQAGYSLTLERGSAQARVSGQIERKVVRGRSRRGPVSTTQLHLTDRNDVALGGSGPIQLRLEAADEALKQPLLVEVRPAPTLGGMSHWVLGGLLVLAGLVEAVSTRRGTRVRIAIGVGMAAAFAAMVAASYDPDAPLRFMVASVLFAVAAGGIGGWLVGAISVSLFGKRQVVPSDA